VEGTPTPKTLSQTNLANSTWKKVSYLSAGDEIATIDGFEKIVSIKKTGRKQVYDLAIEAMHNFVAGHYVNSRTCQALTGEQEKLFAAWKQSARNQKTPQSGDLVNLANSLSGWPDNLDSSLADKKQFVNRGVDQPGVKPGRRGLSGQPGESAWPIPVTLSQLEAAGVNEEDLPYIQFGGIVAHNTTDAGGCVNSAIVVWDNFNHRGY